MPTYEYQCPDGHVFEKIQKMTDRPRAKCPVDGKMATRKISGGAGLVFKGSGFYITDYGKDGKGPRKDPTPASGESSAKPEKADTTAKDTTPKSGQAEPSAPKTKKKASGE